LPSSSSLPVLQTSFDGLTRHSQGKVRDIYSFPDDPSALLIVATDRISAFDYVLGSGIPDKGKVLTQLSAFWFGETSDVVPNHLRSTRPEDYPAGARKYADALRGRSMLVQRTEPFPIECVARGYLAGSGWKEYQQSGSVCGLTLPVGLRDSDRLPEPIFTPATKATTGHDVNITEEEAGTLVGKETIERLRKLTLRLYSRGAAHAEPRGIIVADTKFEFGRITDGPRKGEIILIDELLTPDSSRFWPRDLYIPGGPQPSFDKQFVRDYLESIRWNKQPPVPSLPPDCIEKTREKYVQAFRLLTSLELE
jgi:phosphoribosylaminoimidazole-succinocarboxamide synthase